MHLSRIRFQKSSSHNNRKSRQKKKQMKRMKTMKRKRRTHSGYPREALKLSLFR